MSEIAIVLRLEAADEFAALLAERIAAAVAEALAKQTVLLAAQMRLGNADAILRAQSDLEIARAGAAAPVAAAPRAAPAPAKAKTTAPEAPAKAKATAPEAPATTAPVPQAVTAPEDDAPAAPLKVWTDERDAHVKALRERGDTWAEIHETLNKLAGPSIASADACMVHWHILKKSGKLEGLPKVKLTAKIARPPPRKDIKPARASYETVRHWAGERGLVNGTEALDLKKVNAKRVDLGLSPFEIVAERGHRVPA